jgi:dihydropteroate synthase
MGVLNVTPDSFSDGGSYLDPQAALAHAEALSEAGAAIIDLGAESTRPGATPVPEAEEWRRLAPVLTHLAAHPPKAALSVDTRNPGTMLRAADLGVRYLNDVSGGAPPETLARLAAYPGLSYIAMHMHGEPATMQRHPLGPAAATGAVDAFFADALTRLTAAGFSPDRVWVDPGFGFGKTDAGNVALMRALPRWTARYQVAVGISRKGLIGRILDLPNPADRDAPSKTLELGLAMLGARMIRTHEVGRLRRLLDLLDASGG